MKARIRRVWDGLTYAGTVISHPIRGFYDMRFEGKGHVVSCVILLGLLIFSLITSQLYTGRIFSDTNIREFNVVRQIASALIPVLLWCTANWSVTVLMDGEGRFVDIFMATCYATVPFTFTTFLGTALSHMMTAEESTFLYMVINLGLLLSGLLLFTGMLTVHQFSVLKSIFALIVTVAAMAFIAFLVVMFLSIVNQLVDFVKGLVAELRLR